MAVSMASAAAMVEAADEAGRVLLVGHSQSFEAPVRAMRRIVASGELGALQAVNAWYYTDWMFRPRTPDELDLAMGGGAPMRQGAHHVDIVRYLGGGLLHSVRGQVGQWDPGRPGQGAYSAFLEFDDGTPATIVYSGYDHFPSTELTFGIGEAGRPMAGYAVARRTLAAAAGTAEADIKRGGAGAPGRQRSCCAAAPTSRSSGSWWSAASAATCGSPPTACVSTAMSRPWRSPSPASPSAAAQCSPSSRTPSGRDRRPSTTDGGAWPTSRCA
ncbi:Gfo/Idh/MocA family protein [Pseudonocardia benzenivorans]